MSVSVFYARVSSVEQRTDRQRVNDNNYDLILEDKCSGSIEIFLRPEGSKLKTMIDRNLVSSISVWSIDRCGRDLRNIIDFIHYATQRRIPVTFISQGLCTLDENQEENQISKMIIALLGCVAEMTKVQIKESQKQGIELAKLDPTKYLGRKPGSTETLVQFLSKKKNKQAIELLNKGYKKVEVSKIVGLHPNTISKISKYLNANTTR